MNKKIIKKGFPTRIIFLDFEWDEFLKNIGEEK